MSKYLSAIEAATLLGRSESFIRLLQGWYIRRALLSGFEEVEHGLVLQHLFF